MLAVQALKALCWKRLERLAFMEKERVFELAKHRQALPEEYVVKF